MAVAESVPLGRVSQGFRKCLPKDPAALGPSPRQPPHWHVPHIRHHLDCSSERLETMHWKALGAVWELNSEQGDPQPWPPI